MDRDSRWRITQPGLIISFAILAFGFWQLSYHSQFWAGEPLSVPGMFLDMGITVVVGSVSGAIIGLLFWTIARVCGRPGSLGFRVGYFIGLDITILYFMWIVPANT